MYAASLLAFDRYRYLSSIAVHGRTFWEKVFAAAGSLVSRLHIDVEFHSPLVFAQSPCPLPLSCLLLVTTLHASIRLVLLPHFPSRARPSRTTRLVHDYNHYYNLIPAKTQLLRPLRSFWLLILLVLGVLSYWCRWRFRARPALTVLR
ncbi:hypothetical protein BD311DRAFT_753783, partial [Dichomitus squalens]